MGLLDFLMALFGGVATIECPNCGTPGARKARDETVRCKNPQCKYFDASVLLGRRIAPVPTEEDFRPAHPVSIRYVNFAGQSRDFSAEGESLVRKKNHAGMAKSPRIAPACTKCQAIRSMSGGASTCCHLPAPAASTFRKIADCVPTAVERQEANK